MGSLCQGDKKDLADDQDEMDQSEMDQMGANLTSPPDPDIAFSINNLPLSYTRSQEKLAQLQETIKSMQANQKKGKKRLQIERYRDKGDKLPDPYYIKSMKAIYVGQWVYDKDLYSSVPGGMGRLYKQHQILEGQFTTINLNQDPDNIGFFSENLAQILIKQNNRRAKFFKIENAQNNNRRQQDRKQGQIKIDVVLEGMGRKFSRNQQFSGDFVNNQLEGKGQVKIRIDSELYEYKGQFLEGKKHGKGWERFKGNMYDGDFRDDKKNGRGVLTLYLNNKFQEEEKKQSLQIDQDNKDRDPSKLATQIYNFVNKRIELFDKKIESALKDDFPWQGPKNKLKTRRFIDDEDFMLEHIRRSKYIQYYKGEFKNDLFNGQGRYVWFNGKTYEGTWKDGKMEGMGQFFWQKNANYYHGEYVNDLKHGKGTLVWSFNKLYRGSWAFGLRHGYGELISIQNSRKKIQKPKASKIQHQAGANIQNESIPVLEKSLLKQSQREDSKLGKDKVNKLQEEKKQKAKKEKEQLQKQNAKKKVNIKGDPKLPTKIVIIGGKFNKDKFQTQIYRCEVFVDIDLVGMTKAYNAMICKVRGVRVEQQDREEEEGEKIPQEANKT